MFGIEGMTVLEIIARVALIYLACLILLRVTGRREMSELSPMDLLTMLLLSETVSPALTGGDQSITGNVVAASTLMLLCVGTSLLNFKSRKFNHLTQGEAVVLIENGRVRAHVVKNYRITPDDLENSLHQHGMLHVREVKRAFIEADGEITMIKMKDWEDAQERFFTQAKQS